MNASPPPPALRIRCGELLALRLFDIAYAIDLAHAAELWSAQPGRESRRSRLTTAAPKAVAFDVPPLLLDLGATTIDIEGHPVAAQVGARLYDFGVVAFAVHVGVADLDWAGFTERFNALDRTLEGAASDALWAGLLEQVRRTILPALDRPTAETLEEDYLIGIVQTLAEPLSADQLRERADIPALLAGESRLLSDAARRELMQRSYSYYTDDLVVLAWDRAFVYEPRGDSDVADIIEMANAQLVEFRYYDELLDAELPRMYDRVEHARRTISLLASRRVAQLAHKLYTLVAEVTELTEKIDNALQVTEDVYLARVYSGALDLFRVPKISAAVDRKLAIIRDTYAALYDEASSRRAEILEIAIVLLIVIEIALAALRH
jgi:hypothetical protein